jgi:hypothetical protein
MTKGSLVEHYVGLVALGMFLHAVSAAVSSPPASESSTPKRRGSLLPSRPAWLVARTKSIFHTFEWLVCFRQSALAR